MYSVTTTEAAQILGVSQPTVRSWADKGLLKNQRVNKRNDRMFKKEQLEQIVAFADGQPLSVRLVRDAITQPVRDETSLAMAAQSASDHISEAELNENRGGRRLLNIIAVVLVIAGILMFLL